MKTVTDPDTIQNVRCILLYRLLYACMTWAYTLTAKIHHDPRIQCFVMQILVVWSGAAGAFLQPG